MAMKMGFNMSSTVTNLFKAADKNNDGSLSRGEMFTFLAQQGYKLDWEQFEKAFTAVDASGDGTISEEEFGTAMNKISEHKHKQALLRAKFQQYDKNKDGHVTIDEMEQVYKNLRIYESRAQVQEAFDRIDEDKSGRIHYEEFVNNFSG